MNSIAQLFLRLTFGLGIAMHGFQALFLSEAGLAGLAKLIENNGWPAPSAWAYLAKFTELLGGLLIAGGFLTRPAALANAFGMGTAIYMVHLNDGFIGGWELAALYLTGFLAIFIGGPGRISIDSIRADKRRSQAQASRFTPPPAAPKTAPRAPMPSPAVDVRAPVVDVPAPKPTERD
jgi:putative oxidoreductase